MDTHIARRTNMNWDTIITSIFCILIVLLFAKMWNDEQEFINWLSKGENDAESNDS